MKDRYNSLEDRFSSLKTEYDQNKGRLEAFRDELEDLEERLEELDSEIVHKNDIAEVLRKLSVELKSDLKELVEGLTTRALQSIWQEKNVEFELKFEEKRNQIETSFQISEGDYVTENILQEHGGGVADVVAFMLRIVIHQFYEPELPNVLILDEPFKHVRGDDYLKRLGEFIQEMANELDFQIYITTHQSELFSYSDRLFTVELKEGQKIDTSKVEIMNENND